MDLFRKKDTKREQELDIVNKVSSRLEQSKQHKTLLHKEWNTYIQMYKGEQWDKYTPKHRVQSVENIIFTTVESILPLLIDKNPEMLVNPVTDDDIESAESLTKMLSYIFNNIDGPDTLKTALRDFILLGTCVLKPYWDADKYKGLGEVGLMSVDIFNIFVDPMADSDKDMEWVIQRSLVPLRKLKKMYPNKANELVSDAEFMKDESYRENRHLNNMSVTKSETHATVYEHWYYGEEGEIRVSMVTNGILLEDSSDKYRFLERFPYVFMTNHKVKAEFFGISDVTNIKDLQLELNKMRSIILEYMIATTNAMLVVEKSTGLKPGELTGRPNQAVFVNPGTRIDRLAPSGIPGATVQAPLMIREAAEQVSGMTEAAKGQSANGVTAASAIDILTTNAQVRIKNKLQAIEKGMKEVGEIMIAIIMEFYTEPRRFRISDDSGRFKFDWFDTGKMKQKIMEQDPDTGEELEYEQISRFDVDVRGGSSFMLNEASKFHQALELYDRGLVSIDEVLKYANLGVPTAKIKENLIRDGKYEDPNAPKTPMEQAIKMLSEKMKFSVSSTDPMVVQDTVSAFVQSAQQMEQASITTPEGQQAYAEQQAQQGIPPEQMGAEGGIDPALLEQGIDPSMMQDPSMGQDPNMMQGGEGQLPPEIIAEIMRQQMNQQ